VYASAYLKVHFPTAFYTALLNNQPMGFYSAATLVKDAQRRGVRFAPVDVQVSDWPCVIADDGVIRLGLRYVQGLRAEVGQKITATKITSGVCLRFRTLDDFVARTGVRRDELRMLAESGALASLGGDRRSALWQSERAARPAGPLLAEMSSEAVSAKTASELISAPRTCGPADRALPPMSLIERVEADYHTTGLTIGPHPMALVRRTLSARGVVRAVDLAHGRPGRRVRVAGAVITRQRPGTAKGFVFLSLEDETGIANAILTPDVFASHKRTVVDAPYLLVEGVLQNQDGAVSVKAERIQALDRPGPSQASHDFR
jgi:error-prone DNA polymerase